MTGTASTPVTLVAVVGPTAAGKSELALALARRFPAEIVVADSRQAYRGMEIGTAKPSAEERAAVPHHLLDVVDPDQPFTAADWTALARALVPQIHSRGRMPLVVGGNGLFVRGLLDGYDYAAHPPAPAVRVRLAESLGRDGLPALVERLAALDPSAAAAVDRSNPRRVLRALERVESRATGVAHRPPARLAAGAVLIGINRPRAELYRRIDRRAEAIFAAGLLDEMRGLLAAGFDPGLPAMTGHGYAEAAAVLDGRSTLAQAIEITARHTRQYAKRQMTWLRGEPRIRWIEAGSGPAAAEPVVAQAMALIEAGPG